MQINPSSHLRKTRDCVYGWRDGDKFYTSLKPRRGNAARNEHASAIDALGEASQRHLPLVWEDTKDIG